MTKRSRKPKESSARTAHAREKDRLRAERDKRVDEIVRLMANGEWDGARITCELADRWKISRHAVSEYAREASGIVRRVINDDPESIRAEIVAGIEHVRTVAMKLVKPMRVGPDMYEDRNVPDVGAALRAYELRAKMLGLMVDKVDVTERSAAPQSPTEQLAALQELRPRIDEEIAKLEAQLGAGTETMQ